MLIYTQNTQNPNPIFFGVKVFFNYNDISYFYTHKECVRLGQKFSETVTESESSTPIWKLEMQPAWRSIRNQNRQVATNQTQNEDTDSGDEEEETDDEHYLQDEYGYDYDDEEDDDDDDDEENDEDEE